MYSINYLPNVNVFKKSSVLSDSIKEDKLLFGWIVSVLIMILIRFPLLFFLALHWANLYLQDNKPNRSRSFLFSLNDECFTSLEIFSSLELVNINFTFTKVNHKPQEVRKRRNEHKNLHSSIMFSVCLF